MRNGLSIVAAAAVLMACGAAQATVVTENTGWQYGQDNAANTAQTVPLSLDVTSAGGATLSVTDGFNPGDIYNVTLTEGSFSESLKTQFASFTTSFDNNLGPAAVYFASEWLDNTFSHQQLTLGVGTYTLTVKDLSTAYGYPAGFGFRLDAVPEPATWAMSLMGLLGIGAVLRTRRALNAKTA